MGKRRARRQFSADFKRRIVAATHVVNTSVSIVARCHDINANLLFRWRDDPRNAFQEQSFLPVEISPAGKDPKAVIEPTMPSELEIWIAGDVRLVVKGGYEPEGLGRLIQSIRAS